MGNLRPWRVGTGKGNSLYEKLFGENPDAAAILGMANLNRGMFGRYRDVDIADSGSTVLVLARIGGDNRDDYKETIEIIRKHPQYIEDFDENGDETYAYFRFSVLPQYLDTARKLYQGEVPTVMEATEHHMKESTNNPGGPEDRIDYVISEELVRKMNEAPNGGIIYWGEK